MEELLAGDTGLEVARAGEGQARHLGASGVPSFVVNGKVALSGAQPPGQFLRAFGRASESVVIGESCEVDPATGERAC